MDSKQARGVLWGSILAIFLCFVMLLGTTFAWFTDSAQTAVNTIRTGKLDVAMEMSVEWDAQGVPTKWESAEKDGASLKWFDAQENEVTTAWETGKTYHTSYFRVTNEGNLPLDYTVSIEGIDGDAKLLEVLTFTVTSLSARNGWGAGQYTHTDTLMTDAVSDAYRIEATMAADAGSEYLGLELDLTVKVSATQIHDGGATEPTDTETTPSTEPDTETTPEATEAPGNDVEVTVNTAEDLKKALTPAISTDIATITLDSDITLAEGEEWTTLNLEAYGNTVKKIVIDGNGHTISGLNAPLLGDCYFGTTSIEIKDLTLSNVKFSEKFYNTGSGAFVACADNCISVSFENCHLKDSEISCASDVVTGIGGLIGYCSSPLTIKDCSVTNTTIVGTNSSAGAIAGHVSSGNVKSSITGVKVIGCTVTGERANKTGYVVGTAHDGETTITTDSSCGNNKVFNVENSDTIYGRLAGGKITVNGTTIN